MAKKKKKGDEDDDAPKKKKKPVARDDDDDDDRDDEDDGGDAPLPAKSPKESAYTGLLAITAIALIIACVFSYLDFDELSKATLTAPTVSVPSLGGATGAPAAAPAGGAATPPAGN